MLPPFVQALENSSVASPLDAKVPDYVDVDKPALVNTRSHIVLAAHAARW